jgi:hypothetical protein
VESIGGASARLEVSLGGNALRTKLVKLTGGLAVQGIAAKGALRTESDARWFVATFGGVPAARAPVPGRWHDHGPFLALDTGEQPTIMLQFELQPLRAGIGEICIRWTPREPDGNPLTQKVTLLVE